jgi:granule-bound starch synthase
MSNSVRAAVEAPAPTTTAASSVSQAEKLLDIVFVATEVGPWSKTGGLGDVTGSLPVELAKRGHNVFSIAPRYDQYFDAWDTSVVVNVDGEEVRFFHSIKDGVHRVWIDHPWFLAKIWGQTGSKLYGKVSGADYVDNQKRFALFCKAALESFSALPFMPEEDSVIVANDWHTALIPVLIKDVMQPAGRFMNAKVAYTIHNIAFQGRFWPETFADLGLPESSKEKFMFEDGYPKIFDEMSPASEASVGAVGQKFAKLNWLKAGVTSCDKLLTVSPTYAKEMASGPQLGVELDDVIAAKGIEGVVNGMDVADWNPALDKFLAFKYNEESMDAGKAYAKASLQREAGLPVQPNVPVFGFIGRLEEQKGVDILLAALDKVAGTGAQFVILGTGKAALEEEVKSLESRFPGTAVGVVEFNSQVAHLITAGADFMVVPSRFEPCGLIQLHAMTYGTVPLVASTGGLVDTVSEGVTGFQMGAMDPDDLQEEDAEAVATAITRAVEVYGTPAFEKMRHACISQDLSWAGPALKWEAILTELKYGTAVADMTEVKESVPTPVEKIESPESYAPTPSPKPAEVAAAKAAPKIGSTAPVVSPAAKAAASVKPAAPKMTTESKTEAKKAAVFSVSKAPAPTPPKAAKAAPAKATPAKATNGAAKPTNGATAAATNGATSKPTEVKATTAKKETKKEA